MFPPGTCFGPWWPGFDFNDPKSGGFTSLGLGDVLRLCDGRRKIVPPRPGSGQLSVVFVRFERHPSRLPSAFGLDDDALRDRFIAFLPVGLFPGRVMWGSPNGMAWTFLAVRVDRVAPRARGWLCHHERERAGAPARSVNVRSIVVIVHGQPAWSAAGQWAPEPQRAAEHAIHDHAAK